MRPKETSSRSLATRGSYLQVFRANSNVSVPVNYLTPFPSKFESTLNKVTPVHFANSEYSCGLNSLADWVRPAPTAQTRPIQF